MTEHLQKQINELLCTHPKTEIRYKLALNDVKMFTTQCVRCGEVIGQWIPHRDVEEPESVAPIDELLRDYYRETCRELKVALEERIEENNSPNEHAAIVNDWYADYLNTPEWKHKRGLVFERCKRVCEGCRLKRATIVHHRTYKHIGSEFIFELVGVCEDCHDRLHPHRTDND